MATISVPDEILAVYERAAETYDEFDDEDELITFVLSRVAVELDSDVQNHSASDDDNRKFSDETESDRPDSSVRERLEDLGYV